MLSGRFYECHRVGCFHTSNARLNAMFHTIAPVNVPLLPGVLGPQVCISCKGMLSFVLSLLNIMATLIGHFLSVKRGCLPGLKRSMQLLGPRSGADPYTIGS
jgi:hypothetical protein